MPAAHLLLLPPPPPSLLLLPPSGPAPLGAIQPRLLSKRAQPKPRGITAKLPTTKLPAQFAPPAGRRRRLGARPAARPRGASGSWRSCGRSWRKRWGRWCLSFYNTARRSMQLRSAVCPAAVRTASKHTCLPRAMAWSGPATQPGARRMQAAAWCIQGTKPTSRCILPGGDPPSAPPSLRPSPQELVLLGKEQELLEKEQTLSILREEVRTHRRVAGPVPTGRQAVRKPLATILPACLHHSASGQRGTPCELHHLRFCARASRCLARPPLASGISTQPRPEPLKFWNFPLADSPTSPEIKCPLTWTAPLPRSSLTMWQLRASTTTRLSGHTTGLITLP